jgi:hypothetical protein
MQDIIEARKSLRDLVAPFKRVLLSYQLEERLGVETGTRLDEDAFQVFIEITISPASDYPSVVFKEELATVRVLAPSRVEAIAEVYSQVEKLCPKWRRDLEIDLAFSKTIGQQVRIIRELLEYVINQDDTCRKLGLGLEREEVFLQPGETLDVVGHEPGKLIVQQGENQFNIYYWKFTNYVTQYDKSGGPGIRIPTPYLEFTNGYVPWVLGVDEYL